jgi:hypothetical protein
MTEQPAPQALTAQQLAEAASGQALAPPSRLLQLGVLLAVLLVFVRVLFNPFVVFDDHIFLYMNPELIPPGLRTLQHYWDPRHDSYGLYVPLAYTFWWLAAEAGYDPGMNQLAPLPFKLLSWMTHGITAVLAYRLMRKIMFRVTGRPQEPASILGALLWACHPIQVETVAWASGYKDLLAGLGVFLTLNVYFRRGEAPKPWSAVALAAAALGFVAMLGKPSAMTAPALALMLCVLVWRQPLMRALLVTLPAFVVCGVLALMAKFVQQNEFVIQVPMWMRPLAALDALAWYTYTFVLPFDLTVDHARNPFVILREGWIWWTWLLPVGLWAWAYRHRATMPLWVVSAWWVPLGIGPVLGLVSFQYQNYTTVAEHYLYVSLFGLALALSALVVKYRTRWATLAMLAVVVMAATGSVRQLGYWRNTETLFLRAVDVQPKSALSLNNLAALYGTRAIDVGNKGDHAAAAKLFALANDYMERAVAAEPRFSGFWASLVVTRIAVADLNGAIDAAQRMVEAAKVENKRNQTRVAPQAAVVGRILLRAGRLEEAKRVLEFSLEHGGLGNDQTLKETADPVADLAEVRRRLAAPPDDAATRPTATPARP